MKQAIEKAIEGGYEPFKTFKMEEARDVEFIGDDMSVYVPRFTNVAHASINRILLDPLFWQALGKAMGWEDGDSRAYWTREDSHKVVLLDRWQNEMHSFIDHLASNGNADDFFNELLK